MRIIRLKVKWTADAVGLVQSGQAGESHPHLPTEPCVRLSPHTALHVIKSH